MGRRVALGDFTKDGRWNYNFIIKLADEVISVLHFLKRNERARIADDKIGHGN